MKGPSCTRTRVGISNRTIPRPRAAFTFFRSLVCNESRIHGKHLRYLTLLCPFIDGDDIENVHDIVKSK